MTASASPATPVFVVQADSYGSSVRHVLDPQQYRASGIARDLGAKWVELSHEMPGSTGELISAIRSLLASLDQQLLPAAGPTGLGDLRRRMLDRWELQLAEEHADRGTDTNYRRTVHVLALLRRIEADSPGTLHPDLVARLEYDTRLGHVRNPGTEPFSAPEIRRFRSAAHRRTHAARAAALQGQEPTRTDLVAAMVLLALATGEPIEVLRQLTLDSITATAAPNEPSATRRMPPADRLVYLARHDLVDQYAVTYVKNRAAGLTVTEIYTRRQRAAHRAINDALILTAPLRQESPAPALWIIRRRNGSVTEPPWNENHWTLRAWARVHALEIEGPVWWMRFRKAVIATEARTQGGTYLRRQRRHTTQTFFSHYAQSGVLRQHAGGLLLESIQRFFDAAVEGPLIVTPDAQALLEHGVSTPTLPDELAGPLLAGDLDGPHAACRNPDDSPYAPPGVTCSVSATGRCFGCRNAIVTQAHLPAVLMIRRMSDPARCADPEVWRTTWKPIHDLISQVILPAFPDHAVEAAAARTDSVLLDPGTANDMRGAR